MAIYALNDKVPELQTGSYAAREAVIIGNVRLGQNTSVWPGAVLRGDNEPIDIGDNSNIQENCVLHTDPGFPIAIGSNVTVGHLVMLHGCVIEDGSLIGMHSTILNGAKIGKGCLIGAGSVVTSNKEFPPNSLILGSPARVVRSLTTEEIAALEESSKSYVARKDSYRTHLKLISE